MTVKEQQARWPFDNRWMTPAGDVVAVVGFGIGRIMAEHTGCADAWWATEAEALQWVQVTCQ